MYAELLNEEFDYDPVRFVELVAQAPHWMIDECRREGDAAEKLTIENFIFMGEELELIDESIEALRGKGDFIFEGSSSPVDVKNSSRHLSCSISYPKPKQIEFYQQKTFMLIELYKAQNKIRIWGSCDWEFALKHGDKTKGKNYIVVQEWMIKQFTSVKK